LCPEIADFGGKYFLFPAISSSSFFRLYSHISASQVQEESVQHIIKTSCWVHSVVLMRSIKNHPQTNNVPMLVTLSPIFLQPQHQLEICTPVKFQVLYIVMGLSWQCHYHLKIQVASKVDLWICFVGLIWPSLAFKSPRMARV
jgi:hypothetical protein